MKKDEHISIYIKKLNNNVKDRCRYYFESFLNEEWLSKNLRTKIGHFLPMTFTDHTYLNSFIGEITVYASAISTIRSEITKESTNYRIHGALEIIYLSIINQNFIQN